VENMRIAFFRSKRLGRRIPEKEAERSLTEVLK
jgi:hypothetical protein